LAKEGKRRIHLARSAACCDWRRFRCDLRAHTEGRPSGGLPFAAFPTVPEVLLTDKEDAVLQLAAANARANGVQAAVVRGQKTAPRNSPIGAHPLERITDNSKEHPQDK